MLLKKQKKSFQQRSFDYDKSVERQLLERASLLHRSSPGLSCLPRALVILHPAWYEDRNDQQMMQEDKVGVDDNPLHLEKKWRVVWNV